MKPTVYIETTVISYLTARPSRDLIVAAHQQITQEWWQGGLPKFEGFVSPIVLEEIACGDEEAAKRRIQMVERFSLVEVTDEIRDLSSHYFEAIQIPEKARADAYHLALAAWHGIDFLVTWNCVHLASGRVKMILEKINDQYGVHTPIICTPEELMEG